MTFLANLKTDSSIEDEKDILGGFQPLESGLYEHKVALAYVDKSKGGATSLNLHLVDDKGTESRFALWMISGDAKGNKNYYERDGKKNYLPGFIAANSLCLLTVGKEISEMELEEKVISLYSRDAGGEVPTKVQVLVELTNQEILTGVIKQIVDNNTQDASGKWVPSGDTREENEIDKFFRASDRMTTSEIRGKAEKAVFADTWEKKWTGVTRNRAKGVASGTAGAPKAPGAPTQPKTKLFG